MGLITVVATAPDRQDWLHQCLQSLGNQSVLVVSMPDGYELGKLQWVYENTTVDRFLFLQDSVEVFPNFWLSLAGYSGSVSVLSDPDRYGSYLGVYERQVLDKVTDWPVVQSKEDSIVQEVSFTRHYCALAGDVPVMFPDLRDEHGYMKQRFGRDNLVLENNRFRKWKGTFR